MSWVCVLCQLPTDSIVGQARAAWCPKCYALAGGSDGVIALSREIEAAEYAARGALYRAALARKLEATEETGCPGPDCPCCNGEACFKCGAGCWAPDPGTTRLTRCDHDALERHEEPADE